MDERPPRNIRTHVAMTIACGFAGAMFGTVVGMIDSVVCPQFFDRDDALTRFVAIVCGTAIGAIWGIVIGFFLTVAAAVSTHLRCTQDFALQAMTKVFAICGLMWLAGGVLGILITLIHPKTAEFLFGDVPYSTTMLQYAWVVSSTVGTILGAPIAIIIAAVQLHIRWRRRFGKHTPGFSVQLDAASASTSQLPPSGNVV